MCLCLQDRGSEQANTTSLTQSQHTLWVVDGGKGGRGGGHQDTPQRDGQAHDCLFPDGDCSLSTALLLRITHSMCCRWKMNKLKICMHVVYVYICMYVCVCVYVGDRPHKACRGLREMVCESSQQQDTWRRMETCDGWSRNGAILGHSTIPSSVGANVRTTHCRLEIQTQPQDRAPFHHHHHHHPLQYTHSRTCTGGQGGVIDTVSGVCVTGRGSSR